MALNATGKLLKATTSPLRTIVAAYHPNVIDHYENPRNVGSLDKKDVTVGTGLVGAPACGDVMKLQIKVDDNGKIIDAKFKTFGCGSAIASSSLATEWVKGKSIDERRLRARFRRSHIQIFYSQEDRDDHVVKIQFKIQNT